jgi:hypothetical protein
MRMLMFALAIAASFAGSANAGEWRCITIYSDDGYRALTRCGWWCSDAEWGALGYCRPN